MRIFKLLYIAIAVACFMCNSFKGFSQNNIDLKAVFDMPQKQIKIEQTIVYKNTTQDTLHSIYLNDWSHSYATKTTPLANRFAEEFKTEFHFAKNEDRGYSVITSIHQNDQEITFKRLKNHIDVIKVTLDKPLQANEAYTIKLNYVVQIPNDKFTRYGISPDNNVSLRYWYITPAVYNGKWQHFSNKGLDDLFSPLSNIKLQVEYPKDYTLTSELDDTDFFLKDSTKVTTLSGENRINSKLFLYKNANFNNIETDYFTLVTNLGTEGLNPIDRVIISDKIAGFLTKNLGAYPHKKLLLSYIDYKKNPIYGLNLLPNFIRPFPDSFQFELKVLKTALNNYLENILIVNPRQDQWIIDGLQTYFLIKYVDENYPNMKIFGSLSRIWGLKSFHAANLNFNDQYAFLFMHMAREGIDQPLLMQKDSLLKFNKNIANKYKAGIGYKYLDNYLGGNKIDSIIKEFINTNSLKETTTEDLETLVRSKTTKNLDWFFDTYLQTNQDIDYTITDAEIIEDSILVTIKNNANITVPITLASMKDDTVISRIWLDDIANTKTVKIAAKDVTKVVLNDDYSIPEFNLRNNTKRVDKHLFNRPLQLRLFKDIEDPKYNQVFFMPIVEFNNIYDGLVLGVKAYNKTVLKKPFNYNISPQYGTGSNSLTGSFSFNYTNYNETKPNLFSVRYGMSASYESYAENLFVTKFTPSVSFIFRDKTNLRSNKRQYLTLRYLDINRDKDPNNEDTSEDPNYSVFNARYNHVDKDLKNFNAWFTDLQIAKNFGKVAFNYEYRKLTERNRQFKLRLYTGIFLYNNTYRDSDYFSFALDRPTDYLFDYNYYGRSESSGLFSQQLIIAEGGFKSKLSTPFANQWISTVNAGTTIWRYIEAYGDIGLVKNHGSDAKFVYDSGIRFSLVDDYFELYFPVYSNLGWEIAEPNYGQRIRFIITLDLKTLFGLFTRRWY
ncbi:metalloprotease [Corallibacter sp.]|uniref:metalloprotease n=1 Tax=Corallibacter sp. TaxID=2038084 RepID=UPI003AB28FBF